MDGKILAFDINIDGSYIVINQGNPVVTYSKNQFYCSFEFSEQWTSLNKICYFNSYPSVIEENVCLIPTEALGDQDRLVIAIVGTNLEGDVVFKTEEMIMPVKYGFNGEGEEPSPIPSPTEWEQYIGEVTMLVEEAKGYAEMSKEATWINLNNNTGDVPPNEGIYLGVLDGELGLSINGVFKKIVLEDI